jgi:hypothetical protein
MKLLCVFIGLALLSSHANADDENARRILKVAPKAAPGFASLGNLGLLPVQTATLTYGGWITPRPVPGTVEQNRVTIQVPAWRDDQNTLALSAGGTSLHFGDQQTLSGSGIPVPVDLWKIEFGGSYARRLEDDRLIGGRLSLGSASDHPFANFDVTTVGASAFYSWATSERSRWMVTVFFSHNTPIANYVPIPGFVYIYETETFVGMFGLPFSSLVWRPEDKWTFTFSFFGPTVNSEIAYGYPTGLQVFTGYSWTQQSYLRELRPDPKDRLYYEEMHVPLGVRFPLARGFRTELSLGYAFDRSTFEGLHFHSKENGSAPLGNSWFAAWNLRLEL